MKRYEFRLATVLRVRQAEEEREREHLRAANAHLRTQIIERDRVEARYRDICDHADNNAITSIEEFRIARSAVDLASQSLIEARRSVTDSAGRAALAQIAWLNASRRVTIVERLDERRRLEHAEANRLADIVELDDLVTARFVYEHQQHSEIAQ